MPDKIFQGGYMSGDSFTAATWLVLDPDCRLILVKDTKEPQDQTAKIEQIYADSGVSSRVKVVDISTSTLKVKELWNAIKDKYKDRVGAPAALNASSTLVERQLHALYNDEEPRRQWPRSITSVTGLVSNAFRDDFDGSSAKLAAAWKLGRLPTEIKFKLYEFMYTKFCKPGTGLVDIRKNLIVLWSRQSGKTGGTGGSGGAHIELDSSFAGIRQLARYFAVTSGRATVVLVGDERDGKLAALAREHQHIVDASRMWKDPFFETNLSADPYLVQFAFFKMFDPEYNVIHVGMRSGMLESMALMGMTTFYMEPTSCGSGDRMLAFSRAGIPYTRIQIGEPPGLVSIAANRMIDDRHPVVTKRQVMGRIDDRAASILNWAAFMKKFGKFVSRDNFSVDDETRKAARWFAKAELVGVRLDPYDFKDYTREERMEALRRRIKNMDGFSPADLDRVLDAIEPLLVTT